MGNMKLNIKNELSQLADKSEELIKEALVLAESHERSFLLGKACGIAYAGWNILAELHKGE